MSDNVLDRIREKTQEVDLDSILTTSFGGYTKKSVLEYNNIMRQKQQEMSKAFNEEIQKILDEKEKLQRENDSLRNKVAQAESDYQMIRRQLVSVTREDRSAVRAEADEGEEEDLLATLRKVQQENVLLEKDMDEAIERIKDDEQKIAHYEEELAAEKKKVQQMRRELGTYQNLLRDERSDGDEKGKVIYAQNAEIDRLNGEIKYLKDAMSDGNVADLNEQIDGLMDHVELLNKELGMKEEKIAGDAARIARMTAQSESDNLIIEKLREALKTSREQTEQVNAVNAELEEILRERMEQCIELQKRCIDYKVKHAIALRRSEKETTERLMKELAERVPEETVFEYLDEDEYEDDYEEIAALDVE